MPWELVIVKYSGPPPLHRTEAEMAREVPLGTRADIRSHISRVLPSMQWHEEPSLLELTKARGSDSWKSWDAEQMEAWSQPRLIAVFESNEIELTMFGFGQKDPVESLYVEIHGGADPIRVLQLLCEPGNWTVAEVDRDAEIIDLSGPKARLQWEKWQAYLQNVIDQFEESEDDSES